MDSKTNETTIGERLEDLIKEKGITLEEFAKAIGSSKGSVSSWINGKSVMGASFLRNIAEYFNVSADYLLGLSDIRYRQNIELEELGLSNDAIYTLQKSKQISQFYEEPENRWRSEFYVRALRCLNLLLTSKSGIDILSTLDKYLKGYDMCKLKYYDEKNKQSGTIECYNLRKDLQEQRAREGEGNEKQPFFAPQVVINPEVAQICFDDSENYTPIDGHTFERIAFLDLQEKIESLHCLFLVGNDGKQELTELQEKLRWTLAICQGGIERLREEGLSKEVYPWENEQTERAPSAKDQTGDSRQNFK